MLDRTWAKTVFHLSTWVRGCVLGVSKVLWVEHAWRRQDGLEACDYGSRTRLLLEIDDGLDYYDTQETAGEHSLFLSVT